MGLVLLPVDIYDVSVSFLIYLVMKSHHFRRCFLFSCHCVCCCCGFAGEEGEGGIFRLMGIFFCVSHRLLGLGQLCVISPTTGG